MHCLALCLELVPMKEEKGETDALKERKNSKEDVVGKGVF